MKLLILFLTAGLFSFDITAKSKEEVFILGQQETETYKIEKFNSSIKPKNIILMIGDGMGLNQVEVSRLGIGGVDYKLAIDQLPFRGLVTTFSSNNSITDSAAAATAWATGKKTNNKFLSVSPNKKNIITITELLAQKGYKNGLVATSSITHATPAAFYAHVDNRYKEQKIAKQFLESNIDIALGGGAEFFRKLNFSDKYILLKSRQDLMAHQNEENKKLLGLFAEDGIMRTDEDMPSQAEMTDLALDYLVKSTESCNGFFLMSEGSQIDWAGHANNIQYLFAEFNDFDQTIGKLINFINTDKETLLIITADHETGGLQLVDKLDNKVKIKWTTKNHTAVPVGIYAYGPGAELFSEEMDNTDIFYKMIEVIDYENAADGVCQ